MKEHGFSLRPDLRIRVAVWPLPLVLAPLGRRRAPGEGTRVPGRALR